MKRVNNILLTGAPGIGKTTIIRRIVSEMTVPAGGFYTQEIREGQFRMGFRIISLDDREGILAHRHFKSPYRVGRYGVNIEDVERIGVSALVRARENNDCIVIDEIGRMELFSKAFQEEVLRCLAASTIVVGTIQKKKIPFLERIRARGDVVLVDVSLTNRDGLHLQILDMLSEINGAG